MRHLSLLPWYAAVCVALWLGCAAPADGEGGGTGGGSAVGGGSAGGGSATGGGQSDAGSVVTGPLGFEVEVLNSTFLRTNSADLPQTLIVSMSDQVVNLCGAPTNPPPMRKVVLLHLGVSSDAGTATARSYPIDNRTPNATKEGVVAVRANLYADGGTQTLSSRSSGTVTLTSVTAAGVSGFADLVFELDGGAQSAASVTFAAPRCL